MGTRCPNTRWTPYYLPASFFLLNSERRGGSEGGLSGQRPALHPGYSLTFLRTANMH